MALHCVDSDLKIENFDRICRSCLGEYPLFNIFTTYFEGEHLGTILKRLFCDTVSNLIKDKMPQQLCQICTQQILECYQFRSKYRQSQLILQNILSIHNFSKEKETEEIESYQVEDESNMVGQTPELNIETSESQKESENNENQLQDSTENYLDTFEEIVESVPDPKPLTDSEDALPSKAIYECGLCGGLKFENRGLYLKHRREVRHDRPKYPCEFCGKLLIKGRLERHIRTHTREKPFSCDLCSLKFTVKRNKDRHMKIHTGEKSYVCEFCGKGFIQKQHLQKHRSRHHLNEKPFMCESCGKAFVSKHELANHGKTHMRQTTRRKIRRKPYKILNYKCVFCQEDFASLLTLTRHKQLEHSDQLIPCGMCNRKFTNLRAIDFHIARSHAGDKRYKCDICSKNFATIANLNIHLLVHSGEKPFKCNFCVMEFRQRGHLLSHSRIHTGEKPYNCQYCDKSFRLLGNLNVHVRLHTGERPYKCQICPKAFSDLNGLKRHRKRHEKVVIDGEQC